MVRELEERSWGILFGSAMATAAVKGTGLVLCCSVNGQDSAIISGLLLGKPDNLISWQA